MSVYQALSIARNRNKGAQGPPTGPDLLSHHEHNWKRQIPKIVQRMRLGEDIALVSDAGTPTISDPGSQLVLECAQQGVPVVGVPGPCAVSCALSISGFSLAEGYSFHGFLPRKSGAR